MFTIYNSNFVSVKHYVSSSIENREVYFTVERKIWNIVYKGLYVKLESVEIGKSLNLFSVMDTHVLPIHEQSNFFNYTEAVRLQKKDHDVCIIKLSQNKVIWRRGESGVEWWKIFKSFWCPYLPKEAWFWHLI